MLPSLENLRCFEAAARLLRFRSAAKTVGLTPAAFGQRIKQLEEEVGAALFERTTRSVRLTEAGLALLPHARTCLDAAKTCVNAVRGDHLPMPEELTLGTRHELGLSWVLPQLDGLSRAFPNVTFHLYFGSGEDLVLRVRSLEVDCAITSSRIVDPELDVLRLHEEDYVFVAAPKRLAEQPFRRGDDCQKHTLLDISLDLPLFRYWQEAYKGGDRMRFRKILRLGTIAAIRDRVLAGDGVAVLPNYLVKGDLDDKRLVEIMPTIRANRDFFRLVFRRQDPRRSFFENLAGQLAQVPLQ